MIHPRLDDFEFNIERDADGTRYVTSNNLPGFRLIVRVEENFDEAVSDALNDFLPLYGAVQNDR